MRTSWLQVVQRTVTQNQLLTDAHQLATDGSTVTHDQLLPDAHKLAADSVTDTDTQPVVAL